MLLSEFFKFGLSSRAWSFYDSDFNWVKLNTNNNAIFIANAFLTTLKERHYMLQMKLSNKQI